MAASNKERRTDCTATRTLLLASLPSLFTCIAFLEFYTFSLPPQISSIGPCLQACCRKKPCYHRISYVTLNSNPKSNPLSRHSRYAQHHHQDHHNHNHHNKQEHTDFLVSQCFHETCLRRVHYRVRLVFKSNVIPWRQSVLRTSLKTEADRAPET